MTSKEGGGDRTHRPILSNIRDCSHTYIESASEASHRPPTPCRTEPTMPNTRSNIAVTHHARWVVALFTVAAFAVSAVGQTLEARLKTLLDETRFGSARVGVLAVDADTGEVLLAHNADDVFVPASNMKLITSGAALIGLGTDFEFRTTFTVIGDTLTIKGDGDPALADPTLLAQMSGNVETFLDRLTDAVIAADPDKKLRKIVVDDTVFDREYVHPSWEASDLTKPYGAQVTGLNFHGNFIRVFAVPETGSSTVNLRTEPLRAPVQLRNRLRVITGSQSPSIWLDRKGPINEIDVHGSIRAGSELSGPITVHEPGPLLASLLANRITARTGSTITVELLDPDAPLSFNADAAATPIEAAVVRTPIRVAMERCNAESANLYAEALLKRLGHAQTGQPGSWSNGAAAIRTVIRRLAGPNAAAEIVIADGSGLSRGNAVSPRTLIRWMRAVLRADSETVEIYLYSLATPGEGTLRRRFTTRQPVNNLYAKSGFLTGVRSLSGYLIDAQTGRRIVFSVMADSIPSSVPPVRARAFHENVVLMLDDWLVQTAPRTAAPSTTQPAGSSRSTR